MRLIVLVSMAASLARQIPRQYDIPVLENVFVRAHLVMLNTVEHYRTLADAPRLVYCLDTFIVAREDGSREDCRRDQLIFVEDGWIDLRSSGDPRPEALIVELKRDPDPDFFTTPDDAPRADPRAYRVRLENRYVRVFTFRLGAGERTAAHRLSGKDFLYPLTSATLRSRDPDGASRAVDMRARVARWTTGAVRQQLENNGTTEAVALIVEVK